MTFDGPGTGNYQGTIQDGANGRKVALDVTSGALRLFSTCTYSGGTTICAGCELDVGYDGATGSITGDVNDNGRLVFATGLTITFSGSIKGTGAVGIEGSPGTGSVIFAGINIYTGGTTIYTGTLELTSGVNGSIVDNAILDIVSNTAVSYGNTISSSQDSNATIENTGTGEVTLSEAALDNFYGTLGDGVQES